MGILQAGWRPVLEKKKVQFVIRAKIASQPVALYT